MQRTVIQTVVQNSFSFPDSCVVGHPHELVTNGKNGKTVLINEFIALSSHDWNLLHQWKFLICQDMNQCE